jgi:hypothetical protein
MIPASYGSMMGWVVILLVPVAGWLVLDYLWTWYRARQTRKEREIPDYHIDHYDLLRER